MRLLADENFPAVAVRALEADGHDVVWIRTDSPGVDDDQILARALNEQRVVVTSDRDFGELVFQRGEKASSGVVLFRLSKLSSLEFAQAVTRALASRTDWEGQFSVVEPGRIRMRPLPARG